MPLPLATNDLGYTYTDPLIFFTHTITIFDMLVYSSFSTKPIAVNEDVKRQCDCQLARRAIPNPYPRKYLVQ